MNYFFLFLACVLALCLAIALGIGIKPPGGPSTPRGPAAH